VCFGKGPGMTCTGPALLVLSLLLAGCGSTGRAAAIRSTVAVAPQGAVSGAQLDIQSGAGSLTLRTRNLGADLYRISTPAGSGLSPVVVRHGNRFQVFLRGHGPGPAALTVLLSSSAVWSIRLDGGSSDLVADLGTGRLRDLDLVAGNAHVSLVLPQPHGTVPVRVAGGASQLTIRAPRAAPVRFELDGGAGSAVLDGTSHTGIAGGTVFTPPLWSSAANRYDVVASAGVGSIALGRS
jgi:hypothetical protein